MNTEMILTYVLFLVGIVLIVKGGDIFVDAATWMAEIFGIPKFIVGATIVSFATTLPELLTSVFGTMRGENGIAIGNAVGSVTANTGMIMAISILALPAVMKRSKVMVQAIIYLCMAGALLLFCLDARMGLVESGILLAVFIGFIGMNVVNAKKSMADNAAEEKETLTGKALIFNIAKFIFGAAGIVIGADLLVDKGVIIAQDYLHISPAIVGATVIAIGTSLPELVTTITAVKKGQSSLSIGNIIGANVIDLTLILPICGFVSGGTLQVKDAQSVVLDMPACFLVAVIAMIPMLICQKFKRWQGLALLAVYGTYVALVCTGYGDSLAQMIGFTL